MIAVEALADAVDQFQRLFRYPTPERTDDERFGATLASFPGQPVILAEPIDQTSWIADRLDRYRAAPCAYLIGTSDFETARAEFSVTGTAEWFGSTVGWLDADELDRRIGLIGD